MMDKPITALTGYPVMTGFPVAHSIDLKKKKKKKSVPV